VPNEHVSSDPIGTPGGIRRGANGVPQDPVQSPSSKVGRQMEAKGRSDGKARCTKVRQGEPKVSRRVSGG
jgi:hypothetical protein